MKAENLKDHITPSYTTLRIGMAGLAIVLPLLLFIAYVCIFRSSDTLGLTADPERAAAFKKVYQAMGWAMIASPAIALGLKWFLQPDPDQGVYVFFVEAVGMVVFGFYWFVKSIEIKETHAERQAVVGRLTITPYRLTDMFNPITVKRAENLDRNGS